MNEVLRECPYCGTVPQVTRHDDLNTDMDGYNVWVGCVNRKCYAQGPAVRATVSEFGDSTDAAKEADVQAAIAAWNRRIAPTGAPEQDPSYLGTVTWKGWKVDLHSGDAAEEGSAPM